MANFTRIQPTDGADGTARLHCGWPDPRLACSLPAWYLMLDADEQFSVGPQTWRAILLCPHHYEAARQAAREIERKAS